MAFCWALSFSLLTFVTSSPLHSSLLTALSLSRHRGFPSAQKRAGVRFVAVPELHFLRRRLEYALLCGPSRYLLLRAVICLANCAHRFSNFYALDLSISHTHFLLSTWLVSLVLRCFPAFLCNLATDFARIRFL